MRSHGRDCSRWSLDPRPMRSPSWRQHSSPASRSARSWDATRETELRSAMWLGATIILTVVSATGRRMVYGIVPADGRRGARECRGCRSTRSSSNRCWRVAGVLLPTSIALGASFVLAVATATDATTNVSRNAARVYTANTIGAVTGALSAGFLLIPRLGLQLDLRRHQRDWVRSAAFSSLR